MSSPGIIMTGKFARPNSSAFSEYMDYMDRDEAVRNMAYNKYSAFVNPVGTEGTYEKDEAESLDDYVRYMANPAKTSRLFSNESSNLSREDTQVLKNQFKEASKNGSVMWQDVFSFDNKWLVEHGYLDPKTNWLDEKRIHEATRAAMTKMLDQEGLLSSTIWTASIHYNTDNIHVHVATVEPNPLRKMKKIVDEETGEISMERQGYRSRKTLKAMKSAFANQLLGLEQERARINELSKQIITGVRSEKGAMSIRKFEKDLLDVANRLPPQKGYQKYGYAEQFKFKEPLDRIIKQFIKESYNEIFEELIQRQEYVSKEVSKAYGDKRGTGLDKENKLNTLYIRLGNSILAQLKEMKVTTDQKNIKANLSLDDIQELKEEYDRVNSVEEKIESVELSFDDELNFLNEYSQEKDRVETSTKTNEQFEKALEKIIANPYQKKEGQLPTKTEWDQISKEFERLDERMKLPVSVLYDDLVGSSDDVIKNYYNNSKNEPPTVQKADEKKLDKYRSPVNEKQRLPTRSIVQATKPWEQVKKEWDREVQLRQDLNRLQRVLKDTTDQWRNEQAYERLTKEINYQT